MNNEKIGILIVGLNGATANTTVAGCQLLVKKLAPDYGMITNRSPFRQAQGVEASAGSALEFTERPSRTAFTEHRLIPLDRLVFGGWDVNSQDAYQTAGRHQIIPLNLLQKIKKHLEGIRPMKGVTTSHDAGLFQSQKHLKQTNSLQKKLDLLVSDVINFKKRNDLQKIIIVFLGSSLKPVRPGRIHENIQNFKKAVRRNHPGITSGMLYALAALETNSPFIDFTANNTLEIKALADYARSKNIPLAGQDGKTGQTMIKTALAQLLKIKNFKLTGWYSTNLLGNMDGQILSLPEHGQEKLKDKSGVLAPILGYEDFDHRVDINYYTPRGDNKEAWDNIDFLGWLGQPMSLKINWLGRDSILAGPLVLDLIRLVEYAQRRGRGGLQTQLAFFFKNPLGSKPQGLFEEYRMLEQFLK